MSTALKPTIKRKVDPLRQRAYKVLHGWASWQVHMVPETWHHPTRREMLLRNAKDLRDEADRAAERAKKAAAAVEKTALRAKKAEDNAKAAEQWVRVAVNETELWDPDIDRNLTTLTWSEE